VVHRDLRARGLGHVWLLLLVMLGGGCSITAGGWSLCLLDHTNLQLSVQHEHADPNGTP